MKTRLIAATRNPGKLREIQALLADLPVEVVPLPEDAPEVEETGTTFAENAALKARGLEVPRSSRWHCVPPWMNENRAGVRTQARCYFQGRHGDEGRGEEGRRRTGEQERAEPTVFPSSPLPPCPSVSPPGPGPGFPPRHWFERWDRCPLRGQDAAPAPRNPPLRGTSEFWVLADDSGLEVDALGGAPGVWSARYAGPKASDADRVAKLLVELRGVPDEARTARFRCAVALLAPDGRLWTVEGSCEGRIIHAPRGTHGFGYDPVFLLPEFGRTMAELIPEQKNRVSHRAQALTKAAELLRRELPRSPRVR